MKTQRDAFWDKVYEIALSNKDVVIVSADMGAPSLDKFRANLSSQYVDVGIAEQQAIAVSAGLALGGKKVFAYAIAPFITLRCYEQIRLELAAMNIPVTLVGVGAGMSYDDSGPTHHTVEDISILRALPNLRIHSITDSNMAIAIASMSCFLPYPNYVRLDRKVFPTIYSPLYDFSHGLANLTEPKVVPDVYLVATGNMVHRALEVAQELPLGVIDIFTLPINQDLFLKTVWKAKILFTLEEHTLPGGLGSAVCELLADNGLTIPVKRLGLDFSKGYCYQYGGREHLQSLYGLDKESIIRRIALALEAHHVDH
ncbi:MAG: transketolase C-terminal domain-containing protein [Dehalococcoidales bacterium]|nr:transketolase C-terminal domain-containing protein [Dehalococcoidales bacterium]